MLELAQLAVAARAGIDARRRVLAAVDGGRARRVASSRWLGSNLVFDWSAVARCGVNRSSSWLVAAVAGYVAEHGLYRAAARGQLMRLRELVGEIARYASDKKALEIVELDLRGVLGYTDYFLVCSG